MGRGQDILGVLDYHLGLGSPIGIVLYHNTNLYNTYQIQQIYQYKPIFFEDAAGGIEMSQHRIVGRGRVNI